MLTTLLLFLASPALAIPAAALLDTQQGPPVCRVKIGTCGGGDFSLLFTKCACDCLGGQCDKVSRVCEPVDRRVVDVGRTDITSRLEAAKAHLSMG